MPALIDFPVAHGSGPTTTTTTTTSPGTTAILKKQQLSVRSTPLNLPELCEQIAMFLDRHTLTVVVRVCSLWYQNWIRHLWRRVQIHGSVTMGSLDMQRAFARLSGHIRHLEWLHQSNAFVSEQQLDSIDLSGLNAETILLSNWSRTLDSMTLDRLLQSSAKRLSVLQLHNLAHIRGDLIKVAATSSMKDLRHFSLVMSDPEESLHQRRRQQRSGASSVSTSGTSTPALIPEGEEAELKEIEWTTAESLLGLLDSCPKLRVVELQDLRSPSLVHTAPSIADESEISDAIDTTEEESFTMPQSIFRPMQYLTTINLHATSVSGSTLSGLFARCPQLTKLNLSQDSALYISGFHLDSSFAMESLSVLHMGHCHFLDGHGLKEILKASPSLRMVEIPHSSVDDAALAVLGRHCLKITDLNLDGCSHITDQGVQDMLSEGAHDQSSQQQQQQHQEQGKRPYKNFNLQCLSISGCTELTGQGVHHVLMTCAGLRSLDFQQPEIMPEALFPHTLETDEDDNHTAEPQHSQNQEQAHQQHQQPLVATPPSMITIYPGSIPPSVVLATGAETTPTDPNTPPTSVAWACSETLELLSIKHLNTINPGQTQFLNARLRELQHLKVLHIGGSQLELSVLNGLGHQLENLYIDDLAREVDLTDVRWLVDHTPNLTRLWCRQLIRHSEPWKLLRDARQHLKLW
ncbi:hypothetical protein BGZ83_007246 [Gryganskiella cystojenkinii]|nr:hypothetical protein BGZ83_007246 [Gryganskiella cystojenkinii]